MIMMLRPPFFLLLLDELVLDGGRVVSVGVGEFAAGEEEVSLVVGVGAAAVNTTALDGTTS